MNTIHPKTTRHASVSFTMLSISLVGAVALLAGCASDPSSRVVSSPPPVPPAPAPTTQTVVVPASSNPQAPVSSTTVIVQQAPPAVQQESMPERPSSQHVWVAGSWAWQNKRYVWIPGQWVIPPRDRAVWVPPRWEREGTGYRIYDGYWD